MTTSAVLESFLEHGMEQVARLVDIDALERAQRNGPYPHGSSAWREFPRVSAEPWLTAMCRGLGDANFRDGALLFQLHYGALEARAVPDSRELLLLQQMRDVTGALVFPCGESPAPALFSEDDRCALLCSTLALVLADIKPAHWLPGYACSRELAFAAHFWPAFDRDDGAPVLMSLCRQIASQVLVLDAAEQFSARLVVPPPEAPDGVLWRQRLRGTVVEALRRGWIGAHEAEQVIALDPGLDPWYLLATSSAAWERAGGEMRGFVRRLRASYPRRLACLAECANGEPEWQIVMRFDVELCGEAALACGVMAAYPLGGNGLIGAAQWAARHPGKLGAMWAGRGSG